MAFPTSVNSQVTDAAKDEDQAPQGMPADEEPARTEEEEAGSQQGSAEK